VYMCAVVLQMCAQPVDLVHTVLVFVSIFCAVLETSVVCVHMHVCMCMCMECQSSWRVFALCACV